MKRVIFFSLIVFTSLIAFTLVAGAIIFYGRDPQSRLSLKDSGFLPEGVFAAMQGNDDGNDADYKERDEIRRSVQLKPGARVEVTGINGPVEIETGTSDTAEIHIVRSARSREDLEFRKILIESSPDSLVIRVEKDNGKKVKVRQRVTLKLPRQVELTAGGVNGRVIVGESDGAVKVWGVNGAVEVAQATGFSEISGINGRVSVTIKNLGERGVEVSGINGAVELRFANDINADLRVSGVNGKVSPDLPNVTLQGDVTRNNFRAQIGSGGSPITASGINGSLRLSRIG